MYIRHFCGNAVILRAKAFGRHNRYLSCVGLLVWFKHSKLARKQHNGHCVKLDCVAKAIMETDHVDDLNAYYRPIIFCVTNLGWLPMFSKLTLSAHIAIRDWMIVATLIVSTVETLYSTNYYSKHFIEVNFDKSTQYVALWTHKRHPIPRPFGRAMECLLWVFQQKLTVL